MNDFMDMQNPLQNFDNMKYDDQILALEAQAQKNAEDANAWRELGKLHQENDEDEKAILCLRKAYEVDPYDLETLMALGISSTNEIHEIEAMDYLEKWLRTNPDYAGEDFPEIVVNPKDVDGYRISLTKMYLQALNNNGDDEKALTAVGMLYFIDRNYEAAGEFFERALKLNPTDPSLWNKYGAAKANNFDSEEAIMIYKQTLELKPNLVRTWANLGIAYSNNSEFEQASEFYLNALALNPGADHIWEYLNSAFFVMKRFDLIDIAKSKNVNLLRKDFPDILDKDNLPEPSFDNLQNHPLVSGADGPGGPPPVLPQ